MALQMVVQLALLYIFRRLRPRMDWLEHFAFRPLTFVQTHSTSLSDRQILISVPFARFVTRLLKSLGQIRSYDWYVVCKPSDGLEEFAKQDEYSIYLHQEAYEWPPEKDQEDTGDERGGTAYLLAPGEEQESSLHTKEERYSGEEEYLSHPRLDGAIPIV